MLIQLFRKFFLNLCRRCMMYQKVFYNCQLYYFLLYFNFSLSSSFRNLYVRVLCHYYKNQKYIKAFCVLAYMLPDPEFEGIYWITVLGGDCSQYNFTSEYLEELSKHCIRMEDVNWPMLAQDPTLHFKIIRAISWKDSYIFEIVDEQTWENWVDDVTKDTTNVTKPEQEK